MTAEVKWTDSQKNAISAGGSVLVSAAAGSGKTAVLVERVIEKLTDTKNPVPANRLLVATYTRAAAAEMRERITRKLDELIKADPYNYHLRRQKLLLSQASICTIDSFCSNLIKENFYCLGISHDFKIGDEPSIKMLSNKALSNIIERLYEENTLEFQKFASCFNSFKNDKGMERAILRLYDFLVSHPFPDEWIEEKITIFENNSDFDGSPWGIEIKKYVKEALLSLKSVTFSSVDYLENILADLNEYGFCKKLNTSASELSAKDFDKLKSGLEKLLVLFKCDYELVNSLIFYLENDFFKIKSAIDDYNYGTLRTSGVVSASIDFNGLKNSRDVFKKNIEKISACVNFTSNQFNEDIDALKIIVNEIFKAVNMYREEFLRIKTEANIFEFSDIEHFALKLLVEKSGGEYKFTELAKAVSKKFDEVMVDEYQDTNEVQNLIFKAVSNNESHLFTVGDVKQSIYRFRQAKPEIFIEKSEAYPVYRDSSQKQSKIILDNNFRSRKEITDTVNFIFRNIMSKEFGEIDYNVEQELKASAKGYPELSEKAVKYTVIQNETDKSMAEVEPQYIAEYINDQINNGFITKNGELVHPTFSDFAILMRSPGEKCLTYVKILNEYGIPAVTEKENGFFENREIKLISALMNVIDNPLQDIPLAAVMTSPIFGFTFDELALMRKDNKKEKLYFSVKEYSKESKKAESFLEAIEELRILSLSMPSSDFINTVYDKLDIKAIIGSMNNGAYRINNLILFREYCLMYEKSGNKSLGGFVKYINRIVEMEKDLSSAKNDANSSMNAVKIMSIHSSKGLEFPICIVSDLGKAFNNEGLRQNVLISADLGVGTMRKTDDGLFKFNTVPRQAVKLSLERTEKSEEIRVLYVALTRAKEKLFMLNTVEKADDYIQKLLLKISKDKKISPYSLLSCNSFGEIITMCALLHKDGEVLRNRALCDDDFYQKGNYPGWSVCLTTHKQSPEISLKEPEIINTEPDFELIESLKQRFNFSYAYAPLVNMPIKVSVSEISKEDSEKFDFTLRPSFMYKSGLTSAEKGTAMHKFFELCDFENASRNVEKELESLCDKHLLSAEEMAVIDVERAEAFFKSDLVKRILKSEKYEREYQFSISINAAEVVPDYSGDEKIILQGAIDCFFIEQDGCVIIDYKTDNINDESFLISKYKNQLMYYKRALEESSKLLVKEAYIYSVHQNRAIKVF